MTFLLNGKPVDALALIVHRSAQETVGRQWVKKLRMFCEPIPLSDLSNVAFR
jgi:translation elongation factor EF-4